MLTQTLTRDEVRRAVHRNTKYVALYVVRLDLSRGTSRIQRALRVMPWVYLQRQCGEKGDMLLLLVVCS